MPIVIDTATLPESVKALVGTGRYMKHRLEASIPLLKKHLAAIRNASTTEGLDANDTRELIGLLENFQDRFGRLERKTITIVSSDDNHQDAKVITSSDDLLEPIQ